MLVSLPWRIKRESLERESECECREGGCGGGIYRKEMVLVGEAYLLKSEMYGAGLNLSNLIFFV